MGDSAASVGCLCGLPLWAVFVGDSAASVGCLCGPASPAGQYLWAVFVVSVQPQRAESVCASLNGQRVCVRASTGSACARASGGSVCLRASRGSACVCASAGRVCGVCASLLGGDLRVRMRASQTPHRHVSVGYRWAGGVGVEILHGVVGGAAQAQAPLQEGGWVGLAGRMLKLKLTRT